MTKKKKGLFSSIKDKFSKKESSEDDIQKDIEDEFELEDDEDYEDEHDEELEYHFESEEDDSEDIDDLEENIESILASESDNDNISENDDEDSIPSIEGLDGDEDFELEASESELSEEEESQELEDVQELLKKAGKASGFLSSISSKFSKKKNDAPTLKKLNILEQNDSSLEAQEDFETQDEDLEVISTQAHSLGIDEDSNAKNFLEKQNDIKSDKKLSFKDLTPEQIVPTLIGKANQPFIHKSFVALLFVTSFYTVGKLIGLYFSQEVPNSKFNPQKISSTSYNPRDHVNKIKLNNIFNVKETEDDMSKVAKVKVPEIKICKVAERKTSLPIKLLNTIVLQDSVKSVASVSERGKINNYREGDKIGAAAEIGRIDRLKMIFKNLKSGQCEFVENSDPSEKKLRSNKINVVSPTAGKKIMDDLNKKEIEVDGNKYNIKKTLRDKLLSNISEVITQARAIQIKNPDGSLSFKITEIVPGSIFSSLNINNEDIVTGIQGKKIQNVNELMAMFGKLKENDTYELTIKKDGVETNLNYNFVD